MNFVCYVIKLMIVIFEKKKTNSSRFGACSYRRYSSLTAIRNASERVTIIIFQ